MASPPSSPSRNLQGASRTTGGIIRGRAIGNVFNLADACDIQHHMDVAAVGRVHLYYDLVDPFTTKAQCIVKVPVSSTLSPVLKSLGHTYSPVCSASCSSCLTSEIFKSFIESEYRIHTYEDKEWITKGKYDTAIEDDEYVEWVNTSGEQILPLFLV
jgi:hypothetical protein